MGWPRLDDVIWPLRGGLAMVWRVGCNRIARVGHDGTGWSRWGGLAYDGAISFNGVSSGISFVLDEVCCSMLVRFSGSTVNQHRRWIIRLMDFQLEFL